MMETECRATTFVYSGLAGCSAPSIETGLRSQGASSLLDRLRLLLLLLLRRLRLRLLLRLLRRLLLRLRNGSAERRVAWVLGRVRCWVCGAGSSSWVVRVV